ncbi:hypothetical protein GGI17_000822 [Coemansia sp. S146]|nr:hypothetical protein GGI17_000822 [Coemansia sp. S146]
MLQCWRRDQPWYFVKKIEHPPLARQPVHRHLPPESQPAPTPVADLSASDAQAKDKIHARQLVCNGKRGSAKALVAAHKSNVDLSGTLAKRFNAAIELLHDLGLITLSAVAPQIPLPQYAKTFSHSLPPAVAARRLQVKAAIRERIRTYQAARDRQAAQAKQDIRDTRATRSYEIILALAATMP